MREQLIVVDDFYNNPNEVRAGALASSFHVGGNYPGLRTEPALNDSIKSTIQRIVRNAGGFITSWLETQTYNGAFQYTTKDDESWIHCDQHNTWAGVCYLTPEAPHSSGTGFFMHKETGIYSRPDDEALRDLLCSDGRDLSKWHLTDVVSNKFNRLVLYRGDLYHRSLDYFGEDVKTGRLFQTFFFDTEW